MKIELRWGQQSHELDVPDDQVATVYREEIQPPLADPPAAVRQALEHPVGFPPLRRALTPDDHIAIVVDETLKDPSQFLIPIMEHLRQVGIAPQAMTLVCLPPSTGQAWIEHLPDEFQNVILEVHDPHERKHLSYLATTRQGRRIYLNRTTVDADQAIFLTRAGYDSQFGYTGGEAALFPVLSDEATRKEMAGQFFLEAPGDKVRPMGQEAQEVAWLMGAPFFVQIIEGADGTVAGVVAGPLESTREGRKQLDARWKVQVDQPVDLVVGTVGGAGFLDLARAFANAARVVKPRGRIALLTESAPSLGRSGEILQESEEPEAALRILTKEKPPDYEAGYLWVQSALKAKLYLFSGWEEEQAESLHVVPLTNPNQIRRLVGEARSCMFLEDLDKTLAVIR